MGYKKKVLFILPTLHAGGTENYALRFITYCGTDSIEWHVLTPNENRGDLHDNFVTAGCNIYYQSLGYINPLKSLKFYKLLEGEAFDVICTFNGNFGGLPLTIAKIAGINRRIAWHRRSTNAFGRHKLKLVYNWIANRLLRLHATTILSNSQFALKNLYGKYHVNDSRFKVIPNGLDVSQFDIPQSKKQARLLLGLPQDICIIGHVGRFDPSKNHKAIFRVFQEVLKTKPEAKFIFCGKDTDSSEFSILLKQHKIIKNVIHRGLSKSIPLIYRSLDFFFFPSLTEGQPNALIEAGISGVPILPSNIPPIIEILPKNIDKTCVVDPMDIDSAVRTTLRILNDDTYAKKFIHSKWFRSRFSHYKNFQFFLDSFCCGDVNFMTHE